MRYTVSRLAAAGLVTCLVLVLTPAIALAADGHIVGFASDGVVPLEGIRVVPCAQEGGGWWAERWDLAATSDAVGSYDITVTPGTWRIRFVDPSVVYGYQFWPGSTTVFGASDITVGDGETVGFYNQSLPLAAEITGTVVADDGGAPIEDVQVVASAEWEGQWPGVVGARTASDGTYELKGLPPGTFEVAFMDDPDYLYAAELHDDCDPYRHDLGTDFMLAESDVVTGVDASLGYAASIVGTVTGAGDGPLEGVWVWLAQYWEEGWGGWGWVQQTSTAADGSFSLEGLRPGTYRVQFQDPAGAWVTEVYEDAGLDVNEGTDITVAAGEVRDVSAELAEAGHVSGTVTGAGVGPLEGLQVNAYVDVGGWFEWVGGTQTSAVGTYALDALAPGQTYVEFGGGADWLGEWWEDARDPGSATAIEVAAGTTAGGIDAELDPAAHIRGTVTGQGTGALEGISVTPIRWQDDGGGGGSWEQMWWASTSTDASGAYDLGGLEPQVYRLLFQDHNTGEWATEFYDDAICSAWATDIDVSGADAVADAELVPAGHITGTVTSDGVTGIGGITVAAGPYDMSGENWMYEHIAMATTEESGTYDLGGLPAGTYRVQFWDDAGNWLGETYDDVGDWSEGTDVEVTEGGTAPGIDAVLAAALHIRGTVTGRSGETTEALEGINVVPVQWQDDGEGGGWWEHRWDMSTQTGADGTYDIGGLWPQTYRLMFRDDAAGQWATEFYDDAICSEWATDIDVSGGDATADAELAPAGHITGTVTSDGVTGIGGINVAAGPYDIGAGMYEHIAWTQTDEFGDYDLGQLPSGTFRVQFWDDSGNWLGETYDDVGDWPEGTDVEVTAGGTTPGIDAVLAAAPHIRGTVTGRSGETTEALEGINVVPVQWQDDGEGGGWWEHRWDMSTQTGADGTYDIGGLWPQTYRLMFRDDATGQWATEFYADAICSEWATDIDVSGGDATADAELAPAGHITGTVTGAGGAGGLGGIMVAAGPYDIGAGMYEHIAWTSTNGDGTYDLGQLPAGTFRVQFWDDAGNWLGETYDDVGDWPEGTDVEVTEGGTTPGIDAQLTPACTISGTLTGNGGGWAPADEANAVALQWQDDGEGGGWWEELWDRPGGVNPDGTYTIIGLQPGTYRVGFFADPAVWASEFWNDAICPAWGDDIVLGSGESTSGIDADLAPAGHIAGTVTSDGIDGIGGITVAAGPYDIDTGMYEHIAWTSTEGDGTYDLGGLPTGTYRVQFWDDSGNWLGEVYDDVGDWPEGTDVAVSAGGTTPDIDAILAAAGHIRGTVTGEGDGALGGVSVEVYQDEGGWWDWAGGAETAWDGTYDVNGLDSGNYRVRFFDYSGEYGFEAYDDAASLWWDATDIGLATSEIREGVDAQLPRAGTIAGTITGDGTPLGSAWVAAGMFDEATGQWDQLAWTETQGDGQYALGGLRPGTTYRVQAGEMGGTYASAFFDGVWSEDVADATDVTVVSDEITTCDIDLPVGARISGRVMLESGVPAPEDTMVFVYYPRDDGGGGTWYEFGGCFAGTDPDGYYQGGGFSPGTYSISFGGPETYCGEFWDDEPSVWVADDVVVADYDTDVTGIDATLSVGGYIEGTVTDTFGNPLEGVYIAPVIAGADPGEWFDINSDHDMPPMTNAAGHYRIGPVRPQDEIFVKAGGWDYVEEFWEESASFEGATGMHVTAGETLSNVDFTLEEAASISGEITLERPSDGYEGVGATLWRLVDTGGGIERQWVGDFGTLGEGSGNYEMMNLAPGDYLVQFTDARGLYATEYYNDSATPENATTLTLSAGEDAIGIDGQLDLAGRIEGTVRYGTGDPLEGIAVRAFEWDAVLGEWLWVGEAVAGSEQDGTYSLPVRPGTYRVFFQHTFHGWAEQWWDNAATVTAGLDVVVPAAEAVVGGIDATMTVVEQPPIANPGGPYAADEGISFGLDGSESSDPNESCGDSVQNWAWELDNDGQFDDAEGETVTVSFDDDGVYPIALRVTDSTGATDTATTTVTVANVAPEIDEHFDPGSDPFEGQVASFEGTFTDPGTEDTHTATVDWGDGSASEPATVTRAAEATSGTFTGQHAYGEDGTYTVTVTVEDDDGGTGIDTFAVTVQNAAPVVTVPALGPVLEGTPLPLTASFTDSGATDTHTASVDWGDGSPPSTGDVTEPSSSAGSVEATHAYAASGSYTVTVTVTDDDGGIGFDTATVVVSPGEVTTEEIAGQTRFDTGIAISRATFATGSCDSVIIATGRKFPDALGAGSLAGAADCPILLVDGNTGDLLSSVRTEMQRLTLGHPTFTVYIMGGTLAVPAGIEQDIKDQMFGETVVRVAGQTRYDTANECAKKVRDVVGAPLPDAFVVTGVAFPDALLAGPIAFAHDRPIMLTNNLTEVTNALKTTMTYCGTTNAQVIGSTTSVTGASMSALDAHLSGTVTRVASASTWYQQSVDVAVWATDAGLLDWSTIGVATGEQYPDALGASSYLGSGQTPLLLTHKTTLDLCVRNCASAHKAQIGGVTYFGGTLAVYQSVRDQLEAALE